MTPLPQDSGNVFQEKIDADRIRQFMAELPEQLGWHDKDHRYSWPQHVYRFDNVTAAAEILRAGKIYSRDRAVALGVQRHDAANPEIIEQSKYAHKFVRLYFGPRTPMQYKVEGIRPKRLLNEHGAHCPVPVFLTFQSARLLSMRGVRFSNGNIATRGHLVGDDADFLENMPWDSIYHRWSMPAEEKRSIIFHRHAEVLVEDELGLEFLREVICRTGPERETLLSLLGPDASTWEDRIRVAAVGEDLFERIYYYVDDVQLVDSEIIVRSRHEVIGPFTTGVQLYDPDTQSTLLDKERVFSHMPKILRIKVPVARKKVGLTVNVDGHLAYRGIVGGQRLYGEHGLFSD